MYSPSAIIFLIAVIAQLGVHEVSGDPKVDLMKTVKGITKQALQACITKAEGVEDVLKGAVCAAVSAAGGSTLLNTLKLASGGTTAPSQEAMEMSAVGLFAKVGKEYGKCVAKEIVGAVKKDCKQKMLETFKDLKADEVDKMTAKQIVDKVDLELDQGVIPAKLLPLRYALKFIKFVLMETSGATAEKAAEAQKTLQGHISSAHKKLMEREAGMPLPKRNKVYCDLNERMVRIQGEYDQRSYISYLRALSYCTPEPRFSAADKADDQ